MLTLLRSLLLQQIARPLQKFIYQQHIISLLQRFRMPSRLPSSPLVWIDCEMTGLDHNKDRILEIAVGL